MTWWITSDIIINVLCDLVGRYHDDGGLIRRPVLRGGGASFCLGVVAQCIVHWTPSHCSTPERSWFFLSLLACVRV